MKLVGLTGGIGMGKSACGEWLVRQGLPVVDTDSLAHELVQLGRPALLEIAERFGAGVLTPSGQLDRGRLAECVFSNAEARRALEGILHPRIRQAWRSEAARWREEGQAVGVVVIPLLYETDAEEEMDIVVCAACTSDTQRQRLRERGWSDATIEGRLRAQMTIEEKMIRADYVVWTEGERQVTYDQWGAILRRLGVRTDP